MSFIDNVKNCFSLEELPALPAFRAVMIGDNAVYLENIRSIVSYTKEEIRLSLKRGMITISGSGLYIKKYFGGDVAVCGKICKIEKS